MLRRVASALLCLLAFADVRAQVAQEDDPEGQACASPQKAIIVRGSNKLCTCSGGQWICTTGDTGTPPAGDDQEIQYKVGGSPGVFGGADFATYNSSTGETKLKIVNGVHNAAMYATAGSGTAASPWTGWEASVASVATSSPVQFPKGVFLTTSGLNITGDQIRLVGSGGGNISFGGDDADKYDGATVIQCAGSDSCLRFTTTYSPECSSGSVEISGIMFQKTTQPLSLGRCSYDGASCDEDVDCSSATYTHRCLMTMVEIGNKATDNCAIDHLRIEHTGFGGDPDCLTCDDVGSALQINTVNSGSLDDVLIKGVWESGACDEISAPDGWQIGLDLYPMNSDNRGNMDIDNLLIVNALTGVRWGWSSDRRYETGPFNNVQFSNAKLVRFHTCPDTIGFDIYTNTSINSIVSTHIEAFETSVRLNGPTGTTRIESTLFSHFATGTLFGVEHPEGIAVWMRKGHCSNDATLTTYCDFDSECSPGTCTADNRGGISISDSYFSVSDNTGTCSWCSTAPRQTCSVDGDCPASGTCAKTCGTAYAIPSGIHDQLTFRNNYYRNVRQRVSFNATCSGSGASCLVHSDCPSGQTCDGAGFFSNSRNSLFVDDDAFVSLRRGSASPMLGAILRVQRDNGNSPAIDLVDNYTPTQSWQMSGDDLGWRVLDLDSNESVFEVGVSTSTAGSVPDGSIAVNSAPSTGYEVLVKRLSGSNRGGPMMSLQRANADAVGFDLAETYDTAQTWRVVTDDSEDLTIQDMTESGTPVRMRIYNGSTSGAFFNRIGVGSVTFSSATCITASSDRLYHDTDCDETKDSGEEFLDFAGTMTGIAADSGGTTTGATVTLAGGAGITTARSSDTITVATASNEQSFLASGALTCGASTNGKMQVHTTPLQYCDNAATPTLQYAAYGSSTGVATSATALAANGSNCSAGNYPLGVDASGAVESCTADDDVPESGDYTALSLTGAVTSSGGVATTIGKRDASDAGTFCSDAGANDTYTCSLSPAITSYVTGTHYRFKANTANTGAATINLNAVGAKTIVKVAGGITTTLADNDIRSGQWVDLVYDGTNMQMQSTMGNAGGGGISGGTDDYLPKYNGTTAIEPSRLKDDGTDLYASSGRLWIGGTLGSNTYDAFHLEKDGQAQAGVWSTAADSYANEVTMAFGWYTDVDDTYGYHPYGFMQANANNGLIDWRDAQLVMGIAAMNSSHVAVDGLAVLNANGWGVINVPISSNVLEDGTGGATFNGTVNVYNFASMGGTIDMAASRVQNVGDPAYSSDAATMAYVDNQSSSGCKSWHSVRFVSPSTSATNYISLRDGSVNATEANVDDTVTPAVVVELHSLFVVFDTAPNNGAGTQSYALTLRTNEPSTLGGAYPGASDETLTCTISETATNCNDTTHTTTVNAGSKIEMKIVPSGTPTSPTEGIISWCSNQ